MRIGKLRILGAPIYVHWSVPVAAALVLLFSAESPVMAGTALTSYFAMLLIHESGHAWLASREGLQPIAIRLSAFHGLCEFEAPESTKQESTIAWGGVLAQLAVAIPIVVLDEIFHIGDVDPFGAVVMILGYLGILIAAINLAPVAGLDGTMAWKLPPILVRDWRNGRPRKRRRGNLRSVK